MDNIFFTFIKPYLSFIDNGHFFRKPFNWLYALIAILNLLFPFYILFQVFGNDIFSFLPTKFVITFIIVWIIIAFAAWISFQLWWDRKEKVMKTSSEGDDFVSTPVFSHLIQTLGEWIGTWIGVVGFAISLILTIALGNEGDFLSKSIGLGFVGTGFISAILMPVYGFLIIVFSRFLAEQARALVKIANNTSK